MRKEDVPRVHALVSTYLKILGHKLSKQQANEGLLKPPSLLCHFAARWGLLKNRQLARAHTHTYAQQSRIVA